MPRLLLPLLVALVAAPLAASAAFPPMWPMPAQFTNGTTAVAINPTALTFTPTCVTTSDDLQASFARFMSRAFLHKIEAATPGGIDSIMVCLEAGNVELQLGVDESYNVTVQATGAPVLIACKTVYGCYHALETLSQMISFDFDTHVYSIKNAPWSIVDSPRFPHRGLLVDSSRHFLSVPSLKEIITSMTYAKINTLHWHIVDLQSFPLEVPAYPKLAKMGAYSPEERFSVADVKEVVEYARVRGVRVMVELDTPGHMAAMCNGVPEICPTPLCSGDRGGWAIDFTKNVTYSVMNDIYTYLTTVFPETLMHLGGDEVSTGCWAAHPYIMQWLADRNLTLDGGYEYYVKRTQALVIALNRSVVGWQEIWDHFGTQLDKRTVIHQWLAYSTSLPLDVTSHGYRLIWSDSSVWYLDNLGVTWENMYRAEPCTGLPDANCKLVLGGEGCMWGETVDISDSLQTIWPRMAAIAERLWSPRSYTSTADAKPRIAAFRCLMNRRGIPAAPIDNGNARQSPPNPGSCFSQ